jgi:hypothetical protein
MSVRAMVSPKGLHLCFPIIVIDTKYVFFRGRDNLILAHKKWSEPISDRLRPLENIYKISLVKLYQQLAKEQWHQPQSL